MSAVRAQGAHHPVGVVPVPASAPQPRPGLAAARLAFVIAAALGMLAGLAEVADLAFTRLVERHLVHVSPQAVWMAPSTYALLYAVLAIPFALLALRRPAGRWLPALVLLLSFAATYTPLLLVGGLYPSARLLLAAGVGVRLGTLAGRHRPALARIAPRLALALALLTGGIGATWNGARAFLEHRLLATLPAARAGTPNILLLIWDTVRADELTIYGHRRPTTPNLARLAGRGIVFDQAFSTAPWTLPSHASFFTGRYPHELTASWRDPLDGRFPTLAEVLSRNGFATAGFVANTYYASVGSGLARGMAHYEDYGFTPGDFFMSTALGRELVRVHSLRDCLTGGQIPGRKSAERVDGDFLSWLDRRPAGHPFFAFLNYYDAHSPYLPPAPFDTLFQTGRGRVPLIWKGYRLTAAEVYAERRAYDAAIAYLDAQLEALVQALRQRGLLDNTIVVLASDHGEEFGGHRVFLHGNSIYAVSLHVPLVVFDPRRPGGVRVPDPVSLRDLPATLLDLAGVPNGTFPGSSLATLWRRPATRPEAPLLAEVGQASGLPGWYPVSVGDLHSVIAGGYQLILNGNGREELYDLRHDPNEEDNLAPPGRIAARGR